MSVKLPEHVIKKLRAEVRRLAQSTKPKVRESMRKLYQRYPELLDRKDGEQ